MLRSGEIEVTGHFAQDGCQRYHSQRTMARDRDVMLAVFNAGRAKVAARLGPLRAHWRDLSEASSAVDFLAHEMEPDDLRNAAFIEIERTASRTLSCRSTSRPASVKIDSPRPRGEAALGGFLDEEDDLRYRFVRADAVPT